MREFVITQEQLNLIFNYLANQPWVQVNELIQVLQGVARCAVVIPRPAAETPPLDTAPQETA